MQAVHFRVERTSDKKYRTFAEIPAHEAGGGLTGFISWDRLIEVLNDIGELVLAPFHPCWPLLNCGVAPFDQGTHESGTDATGAVCPVMLAQPEGAWEACRANHTISQ